MPGGGRDPDLARTGGQVVTQADSSEVAGHLPLLRSFVDSDIPMIGLDTENPFFTEHRAAMSFRGLSRSAS